ncbi:hypothetical protein KAFR_0A00430 [Kazachstania africana CBS 2517]|uniref:Nuclear cap-binding protein complex subunit 1 n=1 Tax=Kazachstania africana (strain ATCC 22294 / BCRC 22015 / CBS 2517 / CECT 1963 / NBRC 1671 / NRRL Y-8276) TaxID=1071382 RepID=H2AM81_KAZAF|nr:hypothetical protein KAFR_0A00430 [Kazachstania africana CBS 2517]CCF55481.1 hypothetical protein KAFR_0A00430 [Kazachstania africana CBS 2517]
MFNRKRKGDFDDDEYYRDFKPRRPKRQRVPPVVQLCKEMMPDIRTIGESKKAFEDDIKFLSDAIINEYGQEEYFNNALLQTFTAVTFEQPQKLPAIALLTMTVNAGNEVAGKSILNHFFDLLQNICSEFIDNTTDSERVSNDTGSWNRIKLLLRFFSLVSPMLINDDVISLYKQFFELAVNLNNLNPEKRNALSEAIYTNTLLNIPYLFYFKKSKSEDTEALMNSVEELIKYVEENYVIKAADFDILKDYTKNSPYQIIELVQLALPNLKKALLNNMQEVSQLFYDWNNLLPVQAGNQGFNSALQLPTAEQLEPFSKLDKTSVGSVDGLWRVPRYVFHAYLPDTIGTDFETVIPIDTYAGQLFNDIVIDIVESLEFNRSEVAKQVISLNLFFKDDIFAPAGESIAQIAAIYEENPMASTFKLEDLTVETILSLIFKLPNVSQPFAYFYTLLVDICQNDPKAIAPVFGRAFRFFYNNIENLDFELKLRFLDWFSIQMSNFNFSWKWNEWEQDSIKYRKSFYNPKIVFIKNLIRKELRLTSNVAEVDDSLPNEFKQYLDSSYIPVNQLTAFYQNLFTSEFTVDVNDVTKNDLFFKQDSLPIESIVRDILDFMHKPNNTRDINELKTLLESLTNEYGSIMADRSRFIIVLLIQCLCHSGSRSLSHANKYISDLGSDLKEVFDTLEIEEDIKEYTIIEAVLSYWVKNSQTGYLIVDTMKFADLVKPKSIITFCFTEFNGSENYGLVDVTAIDSVFRTLSQELVSSPDSVELFEFVFEKLCKVMTSSIEQVGLSNNEEVTLPVINSADDMDVEDDLMKQDLLWKYDTAMCFAKSLLRKFSTQYKLLGPKFIGGFKDNVIPHEPTQRKLLTWINEVNEI